MKALLIVLLLPSSLFAFCFEEAGRLYGISPILLEAISEVESGGNPRAINRNADGSYDFGVMQINSFWAKYLGWENWLLLGDPCFNVKVGAWILAQCFQKYGHTWEAVGCYNARSAHKRVLYANRVYRKLIELGGWR